MLSQEDLKETHARPKSKPTERKEHYIQEPVLAKVQVHIEYSKECQPRMANLDEIKTDHLIEFISFLDENLSCQNLTLDNDCLRNSYEKLITDFFLAEIIEDEKGNISNSTNVKDLWLRANDFRRKSSYGNFNASFSRYYRC